MTLAPGTHLGPYEIVTPIGAGGMGEVYRARDTRLGRDVAVKVLPASVSTDPDRLQRFEQEARAAAALNHPNILALYDIGAHHTGTGAPVPYLVTELLEGETLRERLGAGIVPVRKAVDFAVQVAHGLGAAHEKGIVHRDIKPENLFVTADGRVKILDFGLAKLTQIEPEAAAASALPTTPVNTVPGVVLGTIGYMSPEQVRGQPADRRADLFALGAVLYELLSGRRAFTGETGIDMMTAILKEEPADVPADRHVPPGLTRIVTRCLEKHPGARFQTASDLAFALEGLSSQSGERAALQADEEPRSRRRSSLAWATLGALGGAAIAAGVVWSLTRPLAPVTQRLSVVLPVDQAISIGGSPMSSLAISPDGTRVVYRASDRRRVVQLYLRDVSDTTARPLPGTENGGQPFFSPDGRWLGFLTTEEGGRLKKISLDGGSPVTLVRGVARAQWSFGTWTERDTIVYMNGTHLDEVSSNGGTPRSVTSTDASEAHGWPHALPGGKAVVFGVRRPGVAGRIEALTLETGERRVVLDNARHPSYLASGHLLFQRDETVLAVPFDAARLSAQGDAGPVRDRVGFDAGDAEARPQLAVSSTGVLAYLPGTSGAALELGWVTRGGAFERLASPPRDYYQVRLSPDGARATVTFRGAPEVQLLDPVRGTSSTFSRGQFAVWHPDGQRLALATLRDGRRQIISKHVDGSESVLIDRAASLGERLNPASWSSDRASLAYVTGPGDQEDIWILPTGGEGKPAPVVATPGRDHSPRFSPDGRWLAYVSDESGEYQVYVRGDPKGETAQLSTAGGFAPVWNRDGREIFYGAGGKLMAVPVTTENGRLRIGTPQALFDTANSVVDGAIGSLVVGGGQGPAYDVSPDGQRFLMIRGNDPPRREIVIVQHWFEELKRLLAN